MKSLIEKIKNTKDCKVLPPSGQPNIDAMQLDNSEISEFYSLCGGIIFFQNSDYMIEIVPPTKFRLSNPAILPINWESEIPNNDRSNDWYIIAESGPEQRISIDLNRTRIGRCYDSFWDIHASPGECPVIASSLSNLLINILENQGAYWFWLNDSFKPLGDAYD